MQRRLRALTSHLQPSTVRTLPAAYYDGDDDDDFLFGLGGPGGAGGGRLLQPEDLFSLLTPADPQLSPDGTWVAFTLQEEVLDGDRVETSIWLQKADGTGRPVRMTADGGYTQVKQPRWRPGTPLQQLCFIASKGKGAKPQVFSFNLAPGGDAQPLTTLAQGVSGFSWSPDGEKILLEVKDPTPEEMELQATGAAAVAALGTDSAPELARSASSALPKGPWVVERLQMKKDQLGYLDSRNTQLYVLAIDEDGEPLSDMPSALTAGPFDCHEPAWSPDSRRIAFISNRTTDPDGNSEEHLWVCAAGRPSKAERPFEVLDLALFSSET
jgi:dipeptidyl aminopeptidase/acylaminoacyl peptidase